MNCMVSKMFLFLALVSPSVTMYAANELSEHPTTMQLVGENTMELFMQALNEIGLRYNEDITLATFVTQAVIDRAETRLACIENHVERFQEGSFPFDYLHTLYIAQRAAIDIMKRDLKS